MSELAVVSSRPIRLQQQAEKGSRGARAALELAANPSRFLSTVQIGITLIGILAGAFGGATIAQLLAVPLAEVPLIGPYSTGVSFFLVVAAITYFSIVIGELIPKSLALSAPEKIAVAVSRPMSMLSGLAAPVVWILTAPTVLILKLLRVRASVEPPVTDEEIKGLIDAGTKAGVFEEKEQDLFESVIRLGDQRITSVMTPRTKITWIDLDETGESIAERLSDARFSRLPVARGTLDNIVGYATAKALLGDLVRTRRIDPEAVVKQPLYVPETVTILELLENFQDSHTHYAVVVDEFGGVEGVVTMTDIVEALVGELASSQHTLGSDAIRRTPEGPIVCDGRIPASEFFEELGIDDPPGDGDYQTLAGFVLARLGKIPAAGDSFVWRRFGFEVTRMDGNRIAEVRVSDAGGPGGE